MTYQFQSLHGPMGNKTNKPSFAIWWIKSSSLYIHDLFSNFRLKEQYILLSADGPFSNILKFKPPMCFNCENVDHVMTVLDKVLTEIETDSDDLESESGQSSRSSTNKRELQVSSDQVSLTSCSDEHQVVKKQRSHETIVV